MAASSQTDAIEDHGIRQVFSDHLELALSSMPPPAAFESAQHATRAYLDSHDFIDLSGKGQAPVWKMVAKKRPETKQIKDSNSKRGG